MPIARKPGRPPGPRAVALSGLAVRAWRDRLGLSQAAAGAAIGRSREQISRYEAAGAPLAEALAMAAVEAGLSLPE